MTSRRKFICASALLLCHALCVSAQVSRQTVPDETKPAPTFQTAREVSPTVNAAQSSEPTSFEFELSDFSYRVSLNGNGRREGEGKPTRGFNLRLESGEEIRRLYFSEYSGDLLLICELKSGNGGNGGGAIFRLLQPSMRARWAQRIPSSNISARREGTSLFLAGLGFVARLDLRSGAYDWQHAELNRREPARFKAFDEPEVVGDEVLFREKAGYNPSPTRTIVVDRKTGEIVRVE